jgi:PEP-CTERM motif
MTISLRQFASGLALGLSAAALLPSAANAAALSISEGSTGAVTIAANDFEGGLSVNGSLLQQGLSNAQSTTVPGSFLGVSFSGSWIDLGASGFGSRTIYFVNPAASSQVTDILSLNWATDGFNGYLSGTFRSAINNLYGVLPGNVAPGDIVTAGNTAGFSLAYLGGTASVAAPVPEPGVYALVAAGLATVGFARRRKAA